MKKVFCVMAVFAMVVLAFTSCKKEKTYTDLLTQSKGWVLVSATSDPAYHMLNGSTATDLIKDKYLKDFEVDYIIVFNENGGEIVKPGKVVAPDSIPSDECYRAETSLGNWSFDNAENPTKINMQIPFFYDKEVEICYLKTLTEDELRIQCVIDDINNPVKADNKCTFTLTYQPAK